MRIAPLLLVLAACSAQPTPTAPVIRDVAATNRIVIDTRDPQSFADGHAPDAINIQLDYDQLAHRIEAYVPDRATPLAVRGEENAIHSALRILDARGYTDLVVAQPEDESHRLSTMTARELRDVLRGPDPPVVIDVRTDVEQSGGIIEGAILLEQDSAPEFAKDFDRDRRYAVICAGGFRSSQLASWMKRNGFENVTNVIDGMWAWDELD